MSKDWEPENLLADEQEAEWREQSAIADEEESGRGNMVYCDSCGWWVDPGFFEDHISDCAREKER
jgi:hypothetical protein